MPTDNQQLYVIRSKLEDGTYHYEGGFHSTAVPKLYQLRSAKSVLKARRAHWTPAEIIPVSLMFSPIVQLEEPAINADTARLDWVLPVICGADSTEINSRTMQLAMQLIAGKDGREAVDAAMNFSD